MIMNIFAIGAVLLFAYLWMARGLWSALIHLVCTLVAGAVAFGLWETVAYFLLGLVPERGFLTFIEGIAWGAGLLIPFAVALVVTRLIADKAVPANVMNNKILDYVGGALCGAASAAIAVGLLVIAVGYTRVGSDFLGYEPVTYTEQRQAGGGALERTGGLWVPVDRVTAGLYGFASENALRTGTPLAEWYPNVEVAGYANKISYGNGRSRSAMAREDFTILGAWQVGDGSRSVRDLLAFPDPQGGGQLNQGYIDLSGQTVNTGRLVGYSLRFTAGARESSGQVIFGNGQVRLLMRDGAGDSIEAFPVALVSQADASEADLFGRWRFEGNDTFIASVGGGTTVDMGFEFVVPSGYEPRALYVKNTRAMVDDVEPRRFPAPGVRDAAIASGALLGGGLDIADLDTSNAFTLDGDQISSRVGRGGIVFAETNILPFQFQKTQSRGLTIDDDNRITGGSQKYAPEELAGRGGVNADLRVDRIAPGDDTAIVMVDVGPESVASLLGRVGRQAGLDDAPQLSDTDGTVYQAVGFIYTDATITDIRFTPATPLGGVRDLPTLSSARTDQTLTLLFRVSSGVEMEFFALGNAVVFDFESGVEIVGRQR